MKYLKRYNELNESLRDKMLPKSKEDIIISVKKSLGIDSDYIQVKLPEPKDVKKIKTLLELSDEYNIDIKDYEDNNVLICGNIFDVFSFMEFYLNYALMNKRNSRRFHIDYIKDNILNNVNEGLRDKMVGKSEDDIMNNIKNMDPFDKMINAIKYDMIDIIIELIESGYNIDRMNYYALKSAVIQDRLEITELLLKNGSNVNTENEKCLRLAAHKQNKEMFELLLNYGADLDKAKGELPVENELAIPYKNTPPSVKFLNNYPNVNEGLRDKMNPKSEEDINDILKDKNLSDENKIHYIIKYNLDYDLLPRDKDGWCIYNGGVIRCVDDNLTELPDKLYINSNLIATGTKLSSLPENLKVTGHLVVNNNNISELPENLVANVLMIKSNPISKDIKKPIGVNKIIF